MMLKVNETGIRARNECSSVDPDALDHEHFMAAVERVTIPSAC